MVTMIQNIFGIHFPAIDIVQSLSSTCKKKVRKLINQIVKSISMNKRSCPQINTILLQNKKETLRWVISSKDE